jgi:hypothetical protein
VIWISRNQRFHAYPLSGPRQGIPLTGRTIDELAAQIDQAEQAARRPRGRGAASSAREQPGQPGQIGTSVTSAPRL